MSEARKRPVPPVIKAHTCDQNDGAFPIKTSTDGARWFLIAAQAGAVPMLSLVVRFCPFCGFALPHPLPAAKPKAKGEGDEGGEPDPEPTEDPAPPAP